MLKHIKTENDKCLQKLDNTYKILFLFKKKKTYGPKNKATFDYIEKGCSIITHLHNIYKFV